MSESNESQNPLDLDLRTRIAAAIYKGCDNRVSPGLSRQAADVVIRELGLRLDSTCHIHDREGKQRCHRYVTEWIADD